jgi:hypothetical protein
VAEAFCAAKIEKQASFTEYWPNTAFDAYRRGLKIPRYLKARIRNAMLFDVP